MQYMADLAAVRRVLKQNLTHKTYTHTVHFLTEVKHEGERKLDFYCRTRSSRPPPSGTATQNTLFSRLRSSCGCARARAFPVTPLFRSLSLLPLSSLDVKPLMDTVGIVPGRSTGGACESPQGLDSQFISADCWTPPSEASDTV